MQSARSCILTDEELEVKIRDFKQVEPNAGAGRIVKHLLSEHEVKVPVYANMLHQFERSWHLIKITGLEY